MPQTYIFTLLIFKMKYYRGLGIKREGNKTNYQKEKSNN